MTAPETLRMLLTTTRPRYWPRAGLAVIAAIRPGGRPRAGQVTAAGASAALAAAAVYLHNDVCDRDRDRLHPQKRHRPIAAGSLDPRTALTAGGAAAVASMLFARRAGKRNLVAVVAYLAVNVAYSRGGKRLPWLEMLMVASGVPLRIEAGNPGPGVHPWTAPALPAALAVIAAKRDAELTRGRTDRVVLRSYRRTDLLVFGCANAIGCGMLAGRRRPGVGFGLLCLLAGIVTGGHQGRGETLTWPHRHQKTNVRRYR